MTTVPLAIPLLRAAAWFGEDPGDPLLAPGADGFLDVAWGEPDVAFVERAQRRRLSPLARACLHCARRVAPVAGARLVFASRHGEAERTLALLRDLAVQAELSPAGFSMSVHNSVPGLWSILTGDRAPFSAVAAGPGSFGWGLVEALAAFRADPSGPVLFLYGDDRLPDPWANPTPRGLLHAVALLVGLPAAGHLELDLRELREPAAPGKTGAGAGQAPPLLSQGCLRALRGAPGGGGWGWQLS